MFFQLPPTLPAAATVPMVETVTECKKGSRDCFPEDRVGVTAKTTKTTVLDLRTKAITAVFHHEVNA